MITPPPLQKNDTIGIVAPARSIKREELQTAIDLFESWGVNVKLGNNLFKISDQFAGTDKERAADLQQMLDDKEIKAIICARGGYGTIKTTERIDFEQFKKNPKWIVGYSDITVLHSYVTQKLGIKTLHAIMPLNIKEETKHSSSTSLLNKVLFGKQIEFQWESKTITQSFNSIQGELTGGNLSVLYSLRGTPYDIDTDNKILFLEDLDEYLYHVDRMMMNLKTGGKLDNLKALIVGGMTGMNDNAIPYGKDAIEIILSITKDYKYPVIFDCPVGHMEPNLPLIMGGEVNLEKVNNSEFRIVFRG